MAARALTRSSSGDAAGAEEPIVTRWYCVQNDLTGGWAIGNQDKPLSEYDFRASACGRDLIIADSMDERDARAIAALLNEHAYPNCYAAGTNGRVPADDLGEGE